MSPDAAFTAFMAAAAGVSLLVLVRRGDLRESRLRAREAGLRGVTAGRLALAALCLWLLWALGGSAVRSLTMGEAAVADAEPTLREHGLMALGAYGVGLAALAAMLVGIKSRRNEIGLTGRWRDGPLGLGALLLALPGVIVVGAASVWVWEALGNVTPEEPAHKTLTLLFSEGSAGMGSAWWWVTVGSAAVAAPLFEEAVYRGLLQGALVRATGRPWVAIVATSAIFAGVHLGAVPVYGLPTLFVLGVALGVATERTGRIGPGVMMHAGFNVVNLFAAGMG